ncbi:unnamed protein product [Darwinula stevensoni]|uniref:Cation/H+ exchanger transmembrane domain-containing protein n=1 Tax=Darwinula stevensoni TaxID=69355 RepID=A0A7R8X0V2_9CRUS|nr:unnamed protein product [Darwinula stevensoni]CAG0882127.1 unnamed protein product [Darwinula stevensoni]
MQDQAEASPSHRCDDVPDTISTSRWYECLLRGKREPPSNATRCERLQEQLLCPPGINLGRVYAFVLAVPLVWLAGYGLTGHEMLLDGNLFKLYILFFTCLLAGSLTEITGLPGLLGMLVVGMVLGNLERQTAWTQQPLKQDWASKTRGLALFIILIRAGLLLNPEQLRRLRLMVIRLAFLPCIVEAISVACFSNLILGLPWTWAFMLGFVLAAVSPAVVVPCMLNIQARCYGVEKGVQTLLVAAASIDNVLAISAFVVFLSITFSQGSIIKKIFMPFAEVTVGLTYGIILGIIFWFIPNHKDILAVAEIRSLLLMIGGITSYFGSMAIGMHAAGALGVVTLAFVASIGWRRQGYGDNNPVSLVFGYFWLVFQPLLFGLIGTEIDFVQLKLTTVGYGLIILFVGLFFRCSAAFLAVSGGHFNLKEKVFAAIAWSPKATVQAAIGLTALDTAEAMSNPNPQHIEWGREILTIAVMSILVSAPIGGIFIECCASKLLEKSKGAPTALETVPRKLDDAPAAPPMHASDASIAMEQP